MEIHKKMRPITNEERSRHTLKTTKKKKGENKTEQRGGRCGRGLKAIQRVARVKYLRLRPIPESAERFKM